MAIDAPDGRALLAAERAAAALVGRPLSEQTFRGFAEARARALEALGYLDGRPHQR